MAFVKLSPQEKQDLQAALLAAFPSQGALEQLTYFYLDKNLDEISSGRNLVGTLQDLMQWAEANEKTPDMIAGARKINTGNSLLRDFEQAYNAKRSPTANGNPVGASTALTPDVRSRLRDALLKIPQSNTFSGRSAYLIGIPWAQSLNRSDSNASQDIDMIIDQLNTLGKLQSGGWPLLILVDNAAAAVRGFAVGNDLQQLRDELAKAYQEGDNA